MLSNRSIPCVTVILLLGYPDVDKALQTGSAMPPDLKYACGLGRHRVQSNAGNGAVIVRELHLNEWEAPLVTCPITLLYILN